MASSEVGAVLLAGSWFAAIILLAGLLGVYWSGRSRALRERKNAVRRTAQMEALTRINSFLLPPNTVAKATESIAHEIRLLAEADRVTIRGLSGDKATLRLLAGSAGAGPSPSVTLPIGTGGGATGAAASTRSLVSIADYTSYEAALPEVVGGDIRSVVAVPILVEGKLFGTVTACSTEAHHFDEERIAILRSVTDSLGAFLHSSDLRSQLTGELERTSHRLETFETVLAELRLEQDLDRALQRLLDAVREAVGARYVGLAVWAGDGGILSFHVSGMPLEEQARIGNLPTGNGLFAAIQKETSPMRLRDLTLHPAARGFPQHHPDMFSLLAIPIHHGGHQSGALILTEKRAGPEFTTEDEDVALLFGSVAGTLIENIRLFKAVERERESLLAIETSMMEGLMVLDSHDRVVFRNHVLGILPPESAQAGSALTLRDVLSAWQDLSDSASACQGIEEALAKGRKAPTTCEFVIARPTYRNIALTVFPVSQKPSDGILTGLLLRDKTHETELRRRQDAFLSMAAHELRTPMTTQLAYVELLLSGRIDEETQTRWLNNLHENGLRLMGLIDDLLDVSRIESGKIAMRIGPVVVESALRVALDLVRPLSGEHTFWVDVPIGLPEVRADQDKLIQVLVNLMSNAVKYSPDGGMVTVGAEASPDRRWVVIKVSDEGIGIKPADQTSLFTPFRRIQSPETASIQGTGLGLYLVNRFVGMMNGTVSVESEPGQGSTFTVRLPAFA